MKDADGLYKDQLNKQEELLEENQALRERLAMLEQREAYFHVLFEHSPSMIVLLDPHDPDGKWPIVDCNPAFCEMNGYPREELVGKPIDFLHGREENPAVRKQYYERMKTEGTLVGEAQHRCQDGSFLTIQYSTSLIRIGGRELVLGIDRDITERKQAEMALRESEARYRDLFDHVPVGLYRITPQGQIVDANSALAEMLGYRDRESLQKTNVADIFVDPEARQQQQLLLAQTGVVTGFETQLYRRDGTPIWVLDSIRAVRGAGKRVLYYEGAMRDITERKQAEEELKRVNRAYRVLSECNQALVRAADENTLLQELGRIIVEVGGYHLAWVSFAGQDEGRPVIPVTQSGHEDGFLNQLNMTWADDKRGQSPSARAIRTGKRVIVPDLLSDPGFKPWRAEAARRGYASAIALPLLDGEHVFGALTIYARETDAFDAQEAGLLVELAADVAHGILALRAHAERRRTQEALEKLTEEVIRLYEAAKLLGHTLDLEAIYQAVYDVVSSAMDCDRLTISSYDPGDELIRCVYARHEGKQLDMSDFPSVPLDPEGQDNQSLAIRTGETRYLADYQAQLKTTQTGRQVNGSGSTDRDPLSVDGADVIRSALIVPLKLEGQVMGVVQVCSYQHAAYSRENETLLEALAPQVAVASANAVLYRRAQDEIAERRKAEEALRYERDLLHTLMDNIPDPIYFKDTDSRFARVNKALAEVLKCATPEDVFGKREHDFFSPEFAQEVVDDEQRIVKTGQSLVGKVELIKWADGRARWGSTTKVPIRDSVGQVTGIVGITRDITDLKRAEEALQRYAERLSNLHVIDKAILNAESPEAIAETALSHLHKFIPYWWASIALFDDETDRAVTLASYGHDGAGLPKGESQPLETYGGGIDVLRQGQVHVVEDILTQPQPSPAIQVLQTEGLRSYVSVPLIAHGELIGSLNLASDTPGAFDPNHVEVAHEVADQLAVAIQQTRLLVAEREQRALSSALADVAAALTSTLDLDGVLDRLIENVEHVVPHDAASIILVERGAARVARSRGYTEPEAGERLHSLLADQPELREMAEGSQPLIIPDILHHLGERTDVPEALRGLHAYISVPIWAQGQTIGFLNLSHATAGFYTTAHAERLRAFADQAAIAITNARLYRELEIYSGLLEQAIAEATDAYRQTKERVEAILNNNPDPILLLRADGTIETGNPTFHQVFGYDADESYQQPPTRLVEPAHAERLEAALRATMNEYKTQRLELVARRKDGTTFDADVALAPIKQAGTLLGVVCSLRDISALKEVERMKDAFVSNVSHELRTPITSLKLNHWLIETNPENRETYMGRLGREIDRLNALIEDLLRLSRLDQKRVELNLAPVDPNALAAQFVEDRRPLAEGRNLSLSFEGTADVPLIVADEGLLGQALSVLLTNALNYTPAGGQITVSTLTRRSDGEPWAGLRVDDTGPGIDPDDLTHLFERFFRGKAGRDAGTPGTGLGLAIAQEIVDRHQGVIEVASEGEPGKGAAFTIWLPVREDAKWD